MKSLFFALLSPVILSSSLHAVSPRLSLERKFDAFADKVFGIPLSSTLPAQSLLAKNPRLIDQYLEEFNSGIAEEIKEYVEQNSKFLGIKDTLLLNAQAAWVNKTQAIIKLLIPLVGTRSAKGLEELKKVIDEEDNKYRDLYLKLHGEKYNLSSKIQAKGLLLNAFAKLHSAVGNMKSAINKKIKEL